MKNNDSRTAIIDAAERLLARESLAKVTMDAMAREAGITKGGLFYYFSSRQEIFLTVLSRFEERVIAGRDRYLAGMSGGPDDILKATVLVALDCLGSFQERVIHSGSMVEDPVLRERIAIFKRRLFSDLCGTSQDPEKAALILFIIDGLWMNGAFEKEVYFNGCLETIKNWLVRFVESPDGGWSFSELRTECPPNVPGN